MNDANLAQEVAFAFKRFFQNHDPEAEVTLSVEISQKNKTCRVYGTVHTNCLEVFKYKVMVNNVLATCGHDDTKKWLIEVRITLQRPNDAEL